MGGSIAVPPAVILEAVTPTATDMIDTLAKFSDVPLERYHIPAGGLKSDAADCQERVKALQALYDAEWRKRGFLRSP
jgi:hypothetical protein